MRNKNIITYIILFLIISISIGYSAFHSELLVDDIIASVRIEKDIRVTGLLLTETSNDGLSTYENYDINSILTEISLPNASSTVTYKVTVTNFGNVEMGIFKIDNLPDNLDYELTDYNLKDKICDSDNKCSLGAIKDFYITIKYKENGFDSTTSTYSLNLGVDFRQFYTITYSGITNNNYPNDIIAGDDLTVTFTDSVPPKVLAYINDSQLDKSIYTYENGVFTLNNVTGNVTVEYVKKVYLTQLSSNAYFKESTYISKIKNVEFVEYVDTSNAVATYDLSKDQDGLIIGWIDSNNNLYIGSEWKIYSKDLSFAFYNMNGLETIKFNNLNTSEATNMYYMFNGASALTSLDVSSFDTSNVTNMGRMFQGLSKITNLDVSNFDTSNVQKMHGMFNGMSSLTNLDVSKFNTSNVDTMYEMFNGMTGLTSLDVSNFNTSKVTNMYYMFSDLRNLETLIFGDNFKTSNVVSMQYMFYYCEKLASLDVSGFDTSKVTNMHFMFSYCAKLTSLDVSGFDTSNVTTMHFMFYKNELLTSLDVSSFDTANVTDMGGMFAWMRSVTSLDVSNFDTAKVTTMSAMFNRCDNLISLDVSNFNTSNVTNMSSMFNQCYALSSLNLSSFDTSKVTTMRYMFYVCESLIKLDLSNFNTSKVTDMGYMFSCMYNVTNINISSFDTSKVTDMTNMFQACNKLVNLDMRKASFNSVTNYVSMFSSVPTNINIIVADDTAKTWIQDKLGEGKGTVTTVAEL